MKSFTQLGKARQRNGAKNCQREKKRKKLCKQQSLLAPNWRGAIADDDYLVGRRNRTTKALAQTTLFATRSPPPSPSLTLVTHMQRRLRVCLRRGLRTFNNAQSDFSRIINLTRVRRAHTWECASPVSVWHQRAAIHKCLQREQAVGGGGANRVATWP